MIFQVDPESNTTHLICRCNHLTSFGGNFIQAPNPIDFDKVFAEFGNLAESGNISVLVTICCTFLLYIVLIVFARRADNRDESKVCWKPNYPICFLVFCLSFVCLFVCFFVCFSTQITEKGLQLNYLLMLSNI